MATTLSVETFPASAIYTDITAYLRQGSLTQKFNTLDFALDNPPVGLVQLNSGVKMTDPAWLGNVASVESSDLADLDYRLVGGSFNTVLTVTATNAKVLPSDTAPFALTDEATTAAIQLTLEDGTGHITAEDLTVLDTEAGNDVTNYLLEDGVSRYLLEDGTDFAPGILLMEGALSQTYAYLTVQKRLKTGFPFQTFGRVGLYAPGLRAGNTVKVTSWNQGYAGDQFQITQRTVRWPGKSDFPVFDLEFGDTPETLAKWATLTAPGPAPVSGPPVVIPTGPVIFGRLTATPSIYPQGGGVVTVGSATFSVSAPAGHSLTVQFVGAVDVGPQAWDNYVAAPRRAVRGVIDGGIYTGAWQETPFGIDGQVSHAVYDLSSAPGIALPSGTYTISIQINSVEFNQLQVFNGWAQAAVTTI